MIISNNDEIKMGIRKLGYTLKQFSEEADIPYPYLINTLNGGSAYREVLAAFNKFGLRYERREGKRKTAA